MCFIFCGFYFLEKTSVGVKGRWRKGGRNTGHTSAAKGIPNFWHKIWSKVHAYALWNKCGDVALM